MTEVRKHCDKSRFRQGADTSIAARGQGVEELESMLSGDQGRLAASSREEMGMMTASTREGISAE